VAAAVEGCAIKGLAKLFISRGVKMHSEVKIYKIQEFFRFNHKGVLDHEQSKEIVHSLLFRKRKENITINYLTSLI